VCTPKNSAVNVFLVGLSEKPKEKSTRSYPECQGRFQAGDGDWETGDSLRNARSRGRWYVRQSALRWPGAVGHALSGRCRYVINQVWPDRSFRFKTPAITIEHLAIRGSEADDVALFFDTSKPPAVVLRDIRLARHHMPPNTRVARDGGSAGSEWHAVSRYHVGDFGILPRRHLLFCRNAHCFREDFRSRKVGKAKAQAVTVRRSSDGNTRRSRFHGHYRP